MSDYYMDTPFLNSLDKPQPLNPGTPLNSHNMLLLEVGDILNVVKPVPHQGLVGGSVAVIGVGQAGGWNVVHVKYVQPVPPGATLNELPVNLDRLEFHSRPDPKKPVVPHSVIQDWVSMIPLRQQGVLLLGLRGPDGTRKESPAKAILRSLRACVMNSGRFGKPMERGETFEGDSFMRMDYICDEAQWDRVMSDFYGSTDEYNIHFYQHLLHAAAVAGLHHPMPDVRVRWWVFYERGCHKLHMNPETSDQLAHRLRDGIRREEDE